MNVKSRLARCEMFAVSPVRRLSMPTTSYPRSRRASERCEPMKPAAPVMTTGCFIGRSFQRLGCQPSVCVFVEEAPDEREPHDLQVESDRPVLDVVQVVLDPLLERRVPAPAVDLRPSGQSRLHLVAKHVLRDPVLELLDEVRPLRPRTHDGHVAAH